MFNDCVTSVFIICNHRNVHISILMRLRSLNHYKITSIAAPAPQIKQIFGDSRRNAFI